MSEQVTPNTALVSAVLCESPNLGLVRAILLAGANPDALAALSNASTSSASASPAPAIEVPLLCALAQHSTPSLEAAKLLLSAGATPSRFALVTALQSGNADMAWLLLEAGAPASARSLHCLLIYAAQVNDPNLAVIKATKVIALGAPLTPPPEDIIADTADLTPPTIASVPVSASASSKSVSSSSSSLLAVPVAADSTGGNTDFAWSPSGALVPPVPFPEPSLLGLLGRWQRLPTPVEAAAGAHNVGVLEVLFANGAELSPAITSAAAAARTAARAGVTAATPTRGSADNSNGNGNNNGSINGSTGSPRSGPGSADRVSLGGSALFAAITRAVRREHASEAALATVTLLLSRGCDVLAQDERGMRALVVAMRVKTPRLFNMLVDAIKRRADAARAVVKALTAGEHNDKSAAEREALCAAARADIDECAATLSSAFVHCARNGSWASAESLLQARARADAVEEPHRWTALMCAVATAAGGGGVGRGAVGRGVRIAAVGPTGGELVKRMLLLSEAAIARDVAEAAEIDEAAEAAAAANGVGCSRRGVAVNGASADAAASAAAVVADVAVSTATGAAASVEAVAAVGEAKTDAAATAVDVK